MKYFSLLFLILAALVSCKARKINNTLSTNNLKSYFVTVNSDSGYTLKTPDGAQIKILPNSFDVPQNSEIQIELKEAFTFQDILLGGLATESNNRPLRSAGMLYLNVTLNNKNVKFLKPVQATIPSKSYDSSMQVFKGEVKDDSTINWTNPENLDTSQSAKNIINGKALFKANCANCHKPTLDATGPALAGCRKRSPSLDWAYKFINNSLIMVESDPYARKLKSRYGSVMTQFNLKRQEIKEILDYCDNEKALIVDTDSIRNPEPAASSPCGYDTLYYSNQDKDIEINALFTTIDGVDTATLITESKEEEEEFKKKGYKQVTLPDGMYQFNIDYSGWYNIDVLFDTPNASKVELLAKLQMKTDIDMSVYLCIPKRNILMLADKHSNENYLFHYSDTDGNLPLIINDEALIFATSSIGDKIYYGITKFKISKQQTIKVTVSETNKEQLLRSIKNNDLDGIKLDIEKKETEIIQRPCDGYQITDSTSYP